MVHNYPQSQAVDSFSAKLTPRYCGPFKIIQFLTLVTVCLTNPVNNSQCHAHLSQLKPV
jgi:hypothetical protein